jgi:hypothetical protein
MADDEKQPTQDQPDHTEDPRKQAEGSGGYPEDTQQGSEGGAERERGGDEGVTPSGSEGDRQKNTGNPHAAG